MYSSADVGLLIGGLGLRTVGTFDVVNGTEWGTILVVDFNSLLEVGKGRRSVMRFMLVGGVFFYLLVSEGPAATKRPELRLGRADPRVE